MWNRRRGLGIAGRRNEVETQPITRDLLTISRVISDKQRSRIDRFVDDLIDFDDFGARTEVVEAASDGHASPQRHFVNEFWTHAQRAGHALHEISYRACFKPQLPEFFINRLTSRSETVYDPFMGRGTTLIQAALMGRRPIGNDANPMSIMMTKPRLDTPILGDVESRLNEVDLASVEPTEHDQRYSVFFHPSTLRQIVSLRAWLNDREATGSFDNIDDWIRLVAMSRLTGHSPGFFSVYTLPPNQAASIVSQRRINERRGQSPPERDVKALILRKSRSLLRHGQLHSRKTDLNCGDAQNTPRTPTDSVDLVVTSPPFLDVVNYQTDNHVRAWFAGIDIDTQPIATPSSTEDWQRFTGRVLLELCRVVKPGGVICYEVGEVRNATIKLEEVVFAAIRDADVPVEIIGVLVNQQEFSKTSNVWGVTNNRKGTNTNRVVMMTVWE